MGNDPVSNVDPDGGDWVHTYEWSYQWHGQSTLDGDPGSGGYYSWDITSSNTTYIPDYVDNSDDPSDEGGGAPPSLQFLRVFDKDKGWLAYDISATVHNEWLGRLAIKNGLLNYMGYGADGKLGINWSQYSLDKKLATQHPKYGETASIEKGPIKDWLKKTFGNKNQYQSNIWNDKMRCDFTGKSHIKLNNDKFSIKKESSKPRVLIWTNNTGIVFSIKFTKKAFTEKQFFDGIEHYYYVKDRFIFNEKWKIRKIK
jgi:hypothetical protein